MIKKTRLQILSEKQQDLLAIQSVECSFENFFRKTMSYILWFYYDVLMYFAGGPRWIDSLMSFFASIKDPQYSRLPVREWVENLKGPRFFTRQDNPFPVKAQWDHLIDEEIQLLHDISHQKIEYRKAVGRHNRIGEERAVRNLVELELKSKAFAKRMLTLNVE